MLRIVEVGIGLALVFTLVALICSALTEWISAILERRSQMLWEGIDKLVGARLRADLCSHPLVQGLVRKPKWFDRLTDAFIDRSRPSYVPTKTFVTALLDVLGARASDPALTEQIPAPTAAGKMPVTVADVEQAIQAAHIPETYQQALLALVRDAAGDVAAAKKNIGDWFDAGMERVSGWYKRWSQLVLLAVSILVAVFLGVDSLEIAKRLWSDPVLREATADVAQKYVEEHSKPAPLSDGTGSATTLDQTKATIKELQELRSEIEDLSLPLFPPGRITRSQFCEHFLGFLLTGIAASLGAPFWFELLNKLVNLRSTGKKPPEPAPAQT